MCVLLFGSEACQRCVDLVLLAELQHFPQRRTGAGKFANSLALSPNLCLDPSITDSAEPHDHAFFFSLEAH